MVQDKYCRRENEAQHIVCEHVQHTHKKHHQGSNRYKNYCNIKHIQSHPMSLAIPVCRYANLSHEGKQNLGDQLGDHCGRNTLNDKKIYIMTILKLQPPNQLPFLSNPQLQATIMYNNSHKIKIHKVHKMPPPRNLTQNNVVPQNTTTLQ